MQSKHESQVEKLIKGNYYLIIAMLSAVFNLVIK